MTSCVPARCLAILVLVLVTSAAFQPVLHNDFIDVDDWAYVLENVQVLSGLTVEGIEWAFKTTHAANWHPLTWISHMVDVQLFGTRAYGHHLVNLLLHLASAVILFSFLRGMTGALWKSFAVAALFAVHPLHVESVAWVAERKDVLSGFFGMVTMAIYLSYVRSPGRGRYGLMLMAFAAGLMAKPMLVSLPLVLLLLDYWPLRRLVPFPGATLQHAGVAAPRPAVSSRVVLEKVPLLVLSVVSAIMTLSAQSTAGALRLMAGQFLQLRMLNAFLSYKNYVVKMLWPADLTFFYPHPFSGLRAGSAVRWEAIGAALLFFAASGLALSQYKRRPHVTVGWFWYVIVLLPVIGVVQAGSQAMADRYTYLSLTGLFVVGAWCAEEMTRNLPDKRYLRALGMGTLLIVLVFATRAQARYWQNSATLLEHCLTVHPDNATAQYLYAMALIKEGKYRQSVDHELKGARLSFDAEHLEKYGKALESRGRIQEAIFFYNAVLDISRSSSPAGADLRYALANSLASVGRFDEAQFQYREVLRARPAHGEAHNNLAAMLMKTGRRAEALEHFRTAVAIDPRNAEAHNNLGVVLAGNGLIEQAIGHYRQAVLIRPDYVQAMRNLSGALRGGGHVSEALSWQQRAQLAELALAQQRSRLRAVHQADPGAVR